ncbi:hypothetical protein ACHQM5_000840 [Ranunculus cassubicifolius]
MLAGGSTLLSPRHRLRSEASNQLKACHYQLPSSMSTQRLDFPCNFPRKDAQRSQLIRPVGLSVELPNEAKGGSCSIRPKIRLSPSMASAQTALWDGRREHEEGLWEKERKNLKRFAEQSSSDEICFNRVKRRRSNSGTTSPGDSSDGENMSVSQLGGGGGGFWFPQISEVPRSMSMFAGLEPPSIESSKEESMCFAPNDFTLPPMLVSSDPWVESEIFEKGDNEVESSHDDSKKAVAGSSTSSDSDGLIPGIEDRNSEDDETGNGSYLDEGARVAVTSSVGVHQQHQGFELVGVQQQHQGFELVSLLLACVDSLKSNNIAAISHFLSRLGELASPEGTPIHRVTAYFTEALALRAVRLWPHTFHISIPREIDRVEEEVGTSLRLLNHVSPIPKFLHFTCNEMMLRAFEGKDRVHIIDFDIKQGLQWPGLFQSLASRSSPPSHVRITGIGESKKDLQETGDRLAGFAGALNLPFEFHAVVDRLEDVRLWMLHVKEKETVAVNCILQLHKMLYDQSGGTLRDFLGLLRSTNPILALVAEQEAKHNDTRLESRVVHSLQYYSALFDSIDTSLPLNSSVRVKIEEMYAREIRNIVGFEGSERFERHESFKDWRQLMEQGGFRCKRIGDREMLQSRMLLRMYSCEQYNLEKQGEDGAALTLRWQDQPLYTVSAWSPIDLAGSSSSVSQP